MRKQPWLPPKPKNARKCKCGNGKMLQVSFTYGFWGMIEVNCTKCGGKGFLN